MAFWPRPQRDERSAPCARCTLVSDELICQWCGHDPDDPDAVAALDERRTHLLGLRSDAAARRAWLEARRVEPFASCPACGQWGRYGLCEHCAFDHTDEVAVAALEAHHTHRLGLRRQRQGAAFLGPKGTCPRCWVRTAEATCAWCGHDSTDPDAQAALVEARWSAWEQRRRPRQARQLRLASDTPAFMTCPNCRQWSRQGLCEWCDFDAGDELAVQARRRAFEAQALAQAEGRAARWARLRDRIAPPSKRADRQVDALAGQPPTAEEKRFMTCPSCRSWSSAPVCDWCDFDATDTEAVTHLQEEWRFEHRRAELHRRRLFAAVRNLFRFDVGEHARLIGHLLKWVVLGAVVGVLAGVASAGFLLSLEWMTNVRLAHPWLLFGLPLAGFVIGCAYHYGGGRSAEGNNLIIDEIHDPHSWIPTRMAPLVYIGTIATHLFGGSAGREGTAIQMSGSLTDRFDRIARLSPEDRRLMLIAAMGGGFGAVFGVPIAGCVFGLEVQSVGRIRYDAIVPALTASVVGDMVVRGLGVHHTPMPQIAGITITALLVAKVALGGLAFGLTSVAFSELTHGIKRVAKASIGWAPLRPLIGGLLIIGLTYLVGTQDYLGLSIPLITKAVAGGAGVIAFAFAFKLLFTAVTLGAGFQGGEVTPLFVIGATLGVTLGHLLGVPVPLMAAIGFVAVFAGATNTPLACTVMGVELFGGSTMVLFAVACVVSYVFSSHRGIYNSQRVDTPKGSDEVGSDEADRRTLTLHHLARQRRTWLPARGSRPDAEPAATNQPVDPGDEREEDAS